MITDTANKICQTPPLEMSNQGVTLSGDAKVKVGGVIGKIADLGISGAAEYQTEHSSGLLQKDLAAAIQNGDSCRLEVLKTLSRDLIGEPNPGHSTPLSRPTSTPPPPRSIN